MPIPRFALKHWRVFALVSGCLLQVQIGVALHSILVISQYESTQGVVVSSHVRGPIGSLTQVYEPIVTYEFIVGKGVFRGDRYALPVSYGSEEWAENARARLVPGSKCTVYYNVEKPTLSVLHRFPPRCFVVSSIVCGVVGMCLFVSVAWNWYHRKGDGI